MIKTLAEYEKKLEQFHSSKPEFKQAAKQIAELLVNSPESARKLFKETCSNLNLVYWESLALSDLVCIEKEKILAGL